LASAQKRSSRAGLSGGHCPDSYLAAGRILSGVSTFYSSPHEFSSGRCRKNTIEPRVVVWDVRLGGYGRHQRVGELCRWTDQFLCTQNAGCRVDEHRVDSKRFILDGVVYLSEVRTTLAVIGRIHPLRFAHSHKEEYYL